MEHATRNRLVVITVVVLLMAAAIGARLYQLQVQDRERLRDRALNQHERRVRVPATRGAILDREGRELAVSVQTQSLYAHPSRVSDPQAVATLLAPVIGVPHDELLEDLRSSSPFVYLRRFLDPEVVREVLALDLALDDPQAIDFLPESKRRYPRNELAVHVVGFANIDGVGVEGIERQYDETLRGESTVYVVQQDARRRGLERRRLRAPARRPCDVVLSLDVVLQHIVEREITRAMRETGAVAASAILLDPTNGQVLALANRPSADANRYGQASHEARRNRAVVDFYEPGSTFKVVTMAAALEQKTIRLNQRFFCERGSVTLDGRTIRDIAPHAMLTPGEILALSSNIGMVKIARTLEPEALRRAVARFGFGSKTGIELPGETAGLVTDSDDWTAYTQDSVAFGQEIAVTVPQMAASLATIANNGVWVSPRLVLGTRDKDGHATNVPAGSRRKVLSHGTAVQLRSMMESVILDGTGGRAAVPGYRVAGKSGTAQKVVDGGYSDSEYIASFGGFAPSRRPRLVALVVLDGPRGKQIHGGQVAAPVFQRIMADALRHLRVPYDVDPRPLVVRNVLPHAAPRPASLALTAARRVSPGRVPDLRGLGAREAVAQLADHGCGAELKGSGVVVEQRPAADEALPDNGVCRLVLGTPDARKAVR